MSKKEKEKPKTAKEAKTEMIESQVDKIRQGVAALRKEHGQEVIVSLTNGAKVKPERVLSTGVLSIDIATGVGGLPYGRIIEVFGPASAGKTTFALHCLVEAQKLGPCAFIDAEHALDIKYAEALGVNLSDDAFLFSQPDSGEQALAVVESLVCAGVPLVVVDSVAMLIPQKEVDGEYGDAQMGSHARLMSQAMRKLSGPVKKHGSIVLFINQIRSKLGVMYGSNETTTGGSALPYAASIRIDIRRRAQVKDGTTAIGNLTDVKIVKNKCAPPFKECSLDIIWGKGFNKYTDLLNAALELGIVELSGSWFSYNGTRIGQGANNAATCLEANPDTYEAIRAECLKALGI
jgi:recombination protein RecA